MLNFLAIYLHRSILNRLEVNFNFMKTQKNTRILTTLLIMLLVMPFTFIEARNENPGETGGNTDPGGTSSETTDTDSDESSGETADTDSGKPATTGSGGNPTAGNGGSGGSDNSGGQGEGGEPLFGNNQSFPAIAVDGFGITPVDETSFTTPFEGPYTGLSDDELAALEGDTWYAQKTEGNVWQADYTVNPSDTTLNVYGVDWGDNLEAVNPVIGRPFRLELTMYDTLEEPMDGYIMTLLAFPSSLNEAQGTNGETYASDYATVVSPQPEMVIQSLGDIGTTSLTWDGDVWTAGAVTPTVTDMSFGSELNVGGKYIFGGSKGGWKPVDEGLYRITFHLPDSDISLEEAVVGNYADWTALEVVETEEEDDGEMSAATPVIDTKNNLTYVDVTVITQRDGRKPADPGGDEEEDSHTEEALPATLDAVYTEAAGTCEPYLTDYLGINLDNDPAQVMLLQEFLNDTLDLNLPISGYFDTITFDAVKLFQTVYADEILQPWLDAGYEDVSLEGTGYVYITTLETINAMMCES